MAENMCSCSISEGSFCTETGPKQDKNAGVEGLGKRFFLVWDANPREHAGFCLFPHPIVCIARQRMLRIRKKVLILWKQGIATTDCGLFGTG